MTLADINADGDAKLVIADLGTDTGNIKLKVFKGMEIMYEWLLFKTRFKIYFNYFIQGTHDPKLANIH